MPTIRFEENEYQVHGGESVLECLERHGVRLPASCRNGVCQSCIVRAEQGAPPEAAQVNLKDALCAQGCFLTCICYPREDLDICRVDAAGREMDATIHAIDKLNATVARVTLSCADPFAYFPGQFANFVRGEVIRSFSIASLPSDYPYLEFHVARVPGGAMSGWIHTQAKAGDSLTLLGPLGNCFYTPGRPGQPLFLLGTGTGLAPLYGIVRDALAQGHQGPIHLFHGGLERGGLYLVEELRALAKAHAGFHYHPCVLNGAAEDGVHIGTIDEVALEAIPDLKGWRVFLCGDPELVRAMQRKCFMAGASLGEIAADAFLPAGGGPP